VLLTRSPLSPWPKPWFSLDLHVLSAPPAFVLSQDQTLREGGLPRPKPAQIDHFELVLKVVSIPKDGDGLFKASNPKTRGLGVIALLSFQRPAPSAGA
jgi:hypothetical protein